MDTSLVHSEEEMFVPGIVIKEEPQYLKDSPCSESISENTDIKVKEDHVAAREEDQSDATDQMSVITDSDINETFSWAFDAEDEPIKDVSPWRSSSDLPWQAEVSGFAKKPFSNESGLRLSQYEDTSNQAALEYFHMFVPRSLFRYACKETNNYVEFYQDKKRDSGREWWDWTDVHWLSVDDIEEMRTFLGICMVMSVKELPNPQDYWSSNIFVRESLFADTMTAERFSELMQYFYVSNPWRDPEQIANQERRAEASRKDPLYKLNNSLWTSVQDACKALYVPHQDLILRQLSIGKNQHHRRNSESSEHVWKSMTVEDAANGYITNAEFHKVPLEALPGRDNSTSVFPSEGQVCNLLSNLIENSHCVFADSVFISPETAYKLVSIGLQVSTNCSAWPSELSDVNLASLAVGEHKSVQYKDVIASAWKLDSEIYRQLRTFDDKSANVLQKQIKGENADGNASLYFAPIAGHNFTVKRSRDSIYLLSNSPLLSRLTKSDWKRQFWFIIDIALNNANVLWKENGREPLSLPEFTMEVAHCLIKEDIKQRKQPGTPSIKSDVRIHQVLPSFQQIPSALLRRSALLQASPCSSTASETTYQSAQGADFFENASNIMYSSSSMDDSEHGLVKFPGRGRNCRQCTAEQLRTRSGRRRDTQFGCNVCGINLCRATCFIKFHTQHKLKINRMSITQVTTLDFQPPAKRVRPLIDVDIGPSMSLIAVPSNDASKET